LSRVLRILNSSLTWLRRTWAQLGRPWQALLLGALTVAFAGVSVASYRAYEYVQHDNAFCTNCHLMQDAFARFARSRHSDLSCKACHQPSPTERLSMLTTSVVEGPDSVRVHAHVPNERCETCHVNADSSRWRQIAATAGHRVHLESSDTTLRNLQCVDCHSTNLHEFASADATCGKSGCHANTEIRLGAMANVELHCTTCHNFMADTRGLAIDSLGRPLTPHAQQCLGCHAMRQRLQELDIGRDPHQGVCGDCHNPHTQRTAQEINCTTGGCHAGWQTVSFHVGVPHPENCSRCHQPHSWRVEGDNCLRCHQSILNEWRRGRVVMDGPTDPERERSEREVGVRSRSDRSHRRTDGPTDRRTDRRTGAPGQARGLTLAHGPPIAVLASAGEAVSDLAALLQDPPRPPPARRQRAFPAFNHGEHRDQKCADCHSSRLRHGQLIVTSAQSCQSCHHQRPGREQCATCHQTRELRRAPAADRSLHLSGVNKTVTRRITFDHARHTDVECTRCHTNGVTRQPEPNCASCHVPHHTAEANCLQCHAGSDALRTHRAQDHTSCAQCHQGRPATVPATRAACLVCHTAQADHVPGRNCDTCHRVMSGGRR
jgi:hypothetical protein